MIAMMFVQQSFKSIAIDSLKTSFGILKNLCTENPQEYMVCIVNKVFTPLIGTLSFKMQFLFPLPRPPSQQLPLSYPAHRC